MREHTKKLRKACASLNRLSHLAEDAHGHGEGDLAKTYVRAMKAHVARVYAETTNVGKAAGLGLKNRKKRKSA